MNHTVTVDLPTDTQDECNIYEPCQFLLGSFCVLFGEGVVTQDGHTYKLSVCPASGEKRYDDRGGQLMSKMRQVKE
ncbi:hypothetical protein LCGC14_2088420 [marine sediment metagenome]|uniref:Uncharacterized protein n=1 Tax=marine sediment metagenome TaxID=412755 RepID=A0A0F9GRN6_9ZZZZ